jgi:hypothetical protein
MNANPTARPENVFLLQPWSTATSQTRKKRIATAPMNFISMDVPINLSIACRIAGEKGTGHMEG